MLGDKCLEWVRQTNDEATTALGKPQPGDELYDRVLSILDSKARRMRERERERGREREG